MPQPQTDELLTAEEVLAIQDAFGAMVGIPDIQAIETVGKLKVPQRIMVLAAKGITASDARMGFSGLHVLGGRHLRAVGKLVFTLGDMGMRGREDQLSQFLAELSTYAAPCRTSKTHWRDFFDGSLRHDVSLHLLIFWGLYADYWNVEAGRLYAANERKRDKLTGVQQRVLGFADALEGNYTEEPKVADLRRMPPLFQLALGLVLMGAGMYRITEDRGYIDYWILWLKGDNIKSPRRETDECLDQMLAVAPGVGRQGC